MDVGLIERTFSVLDSHGVVGGVHIRAMSVADARRQANDDGFELGGYVFGETDDDGNVVKAYHPIAAACDSEQSDAWLNDLICYDRDQTPT